MKKLFWSIGSGGFYFLFAIGISLILTPYLLKYLTREEYAIFYLINNIFIWFNLFKAGQNGSLKYQLSFYLHHKKYVNRLFSSLFFFYILISILSLIIGGMLLYPVLSWVGIQDLYKHEVVIAYFVLLFNFSIVSISFLFSSVIAVHNREYLINIVKVILIIVQTLLCLLLLHYDYRLLALCFSSLITSVIGLIVFILLMRKYVFHFTISYLMISGRLLSKSFQIGKWFFVGYLAQLLINNIDVLLIKQMFGIALVVPFLLTIKLYVVAIGCVQMIIKSVNPQLIRLYKRDVHTHTSLSWIYLKMIFFFTLCFGSTIFLGNEYILNYWVGKGYFLGKTSNLLLFLMVIAFTFNRCIKSIVLTSGEFKKVKISDIQEGILNVLLSVILGYAWGVNGVIFGSLCASLIIAIKLTISMSFLVSNESIYICIKNNLLKTVCLFSIWLILVLMIYQFIFMTVFLLAGIAFLLTIVFVVFIYKDFKVIISAV